MKIDSQIDNQLNNCLELSFASYDEQNGIHINIIIVLNQWFVCLIEFCITSSQIQVNTAKAIIISN